MQSIVIRGGQAFLPNIAASPEGPQRFNTRTKAFVNVINGDQRRQPERRQQRQFLNLHLGARTPGRQEEALLRNPWAIGFTISAAAEPAYAVSAGSDLLVS